jgi:hypothetical protein
MRQAQSRNREDHQTAGGLSHNTHYHGDHSGNAAFAKDGAIIVAHQNVKNRLVNPPAGANGQSFLPPGDAPRLGILEDSHCRRGPGVSKSSYMTPTPTATPLSISPKPVRPSAMRRPDRYQHFRRRHRA